MSFSETSLLKKFQELNNTQQSVQTLSLWLIHHRKHSEKIVKTWLKELVSSPKCERKITFIYLANDILQNSRKKGYEYMKEFSNVLPQAIENTSKYADTKMRFTLERILNIWKDRKIFEDDTIDKFKALLHSTNSLVSSPDSSQLKLLTVSNLENDQRKRKMTENETIQSNKSTAISSSSLKMNNEITKEVVATTSSAAAAATAAETPAVQAPEPLELIKILQDLESSASSDAVVREKIADLPSKVTDLNSLKNIKDKKEALDLIASVNEAQSLLDTYNERLQQELNTRKQTALLLAAFIKQQEQEAENEAKQIDEWQTKLKQVKQIRTELQVHLESLPDLSSIEEAAILKPLPSAGDLFS